MQTGSLHTLITLFRSGIDLTGLSMLTAVLAVSAWTCLRPQPVLRHGMPAAGQAHGFYLLLCTLAAPLLMFASLACGLALLLQAHPQPLALSLWKPYRSLVWLLYGLIAIQQLYALQRLALHPPSRPRQTMLLAGALLLPIAMALGLLALDRVYFQQAGMPRVFIAAAALAAVMGIALWLPAQLMNARGEQQPRAEPVLTAQSVQPAEQALTGFPVGPSTAQEMETRLAEISRLLEEETTQAEQASQRELLEQHEVAQASTIQQQVNEQKFLFESGLPCNLALLVNGLIILDQPLDMRDHVRGDTLLHAVSRNGDFALAKQLIESGVDIAAVNWAGFSARACTQDPVMLDLLDAAARLPK